LTRVLALDCEMVGVGPEGSKSALARVVVVNASGHAVLDTHVQPHQEVVDYRTAVSGVRPHHLVGAPSLSEVQTTVAGLLHGRLLVGHALKNDLKALMLSHPRRLLRDTARYPPLMRKAPHVGGPTAEARRGRPARLQELAAQHLGLTIQTGEHSPVEDARAALLLYQKFEAEWEQSLRMGPGRRGKGRHRGGGTEEAPAEEDGHAGGDAPHGDPATSQALWKQRRRAQHDRQGGGGGENEKHLGAAAGAQRSHAPGGWSALLQRAASR
jgi:RNA exonuclease 4